MGQWEKKAEALKWESGRFSLPITLFNKFSGVSLRNLKGIIKNRVSGLLKRFKRGEKGLSFEKQRLYSHKLSSSVNRGPPVNRFSESSNKFISPLNNNSFSKISLILFILLFLSSLLLLLPACKKASSVDNSPVGGPVYLRVDDTFSGQQLDVPVNIECGGMVYEKKTEGGNLTFEIDKPEQCTIKVNFSNSLANKNDDYIPAVLENAGLQGEDKIHIDIVKKQDLNPKGYSWRDLIDAYRGRGRNGTNQVWVKQPEKWVVYDPNHVLKGYSDPKHNEVFNNIMEGFKAIEEYTNGFIRAPPRDKVEIKYVEEKIPQGTIGFVITDGEAWELDDANSNDELIRSGAGANPKFNYGSTVIAELVSSIQGGDNESACPSVFVEYEISDVDRMWGRFNYLKREPGSRIVLDGPYGHLYEIRKIK